MTKKEISRKTIQTLIEYNQWKWEMACNSIEQAYKEQAAIEEYLEHMYQERDSAHNAIMEGYQKLIDSYDE